MTITSAPGVPFHRLARTTAHRWWRPVVGTLVLVVSVLGAAVAVYAVADVAGMIAGRPVDADGASSWGETATFGLDLLSLGAMIPCVLFTVWWVQARPAGTVSSVQGRLRPRWLGVCLLVAVAALVLILIGTDLLYAATGDTGSEEFGGWVGGREFTTAMLMLLVLVPVQAAAEEYVCRGWFLQAVGAFVRAPWLPIGFQAVVFAAIHGLGTGWGLADLLLFGAAMGWLAVRTGGLEAGIALHTVNNLVAMGFSAAYGELTSSGTAADAPWQIFAVDLVLIPAYVVTVTWLARRRKLVTTAPVPTPEIPGTPEPFMQAA